MRLSLVALTVLFACGCSTFRKSPKIEAAGVTVTGPQDAGKPATLNAAKSGESLPLSAGSKLRIERFEPVPAIVGATASLNRPAQPGRTVTEITLAEDTVWTKQAETVQADTGTVDNSVALKKIEVAESRILLYAAIGSALLGVVAIFIKYPSAAALCGLAAAIFFAAWKIAELPAWVWLLAIGAVAGAIFLVIGHEKGERAPKG